MSTPPPVNRDGDGTREGAVRVARPGRLSTRAHQQLDKMFSVRVISLSLLTWIVVNIALPWQLGAPASASTSRS